MRARLIEAIVRGDLFAWASIGALWLVVAAALLLQGRGRRTPARVLALLALGALTSAAGLALAPALAIPRVRWRPAAPGDLLGDAPSTWRRLQGPAVVAISGGELDLAVPTADAEGRWLLVGLLSGRPVDGLAPAPGSPRAGDRAPPAGASASRDRLPPLPSDLGARVCEPGGTACRPWPAGWPTPDRLRPFSQLHWSPRTGAGTLAYDVEARLFLRDPTASADSVALELTGDLSASAAETPGAPLFELRRLDRDRLAAVRVVARPPGATGPRYALERADVLLSAPRRVLNALFPALLLAPLALPLAAAAYLLAPARLAAALRRRRQKAGRPAPPSTFSLGRLARARLGRIAHPLAIALAGATAAAPAAVAVASLLAAR